MAGVEVSKSAVDFRLETPAVGFVLIVETPSGVIERWRFADHELPRLDLYDAEGEHREDGLYRYELRAVPATDDRSVRGRASSRSAGASLSGSVSILNSRFVTASPEAETADRHPLRSNRESDVQPLDFVNDDLMVTGSLCVGFDCTSQENFGYATIRLKENNLRIQFQDTSSASSFPTTDWQLTANDSANGGANYFALEEQTSGTVPVQVEGGSPSNSLHIDARGLVGIGTSLPTKLIHGAAADTPTIRLEQTSTGGFTPQSWDLAGNEAGLFLRDVTNGFVRPFEIRSGAPAASLYVSNDGDVGLGTGSPESPLHVSEAVGVSSGVMLTLANNGPSFAHFRSLDNPSTSWQTGMNADDDYVINDMKDPNLVEFRMTPEGDIYINGQSVRRPPDYVFSDDYPLMELSELKSFIEENKHLPDVQSAEQIRAQQGVNLSKLSMQVLKKVEELTLHTLEQQQRLDELREKIADLESQIDKSD